MSRVFTPGVSTTTIPGLNTNPSVEVGYYNQCRSCPRPVIQTIQLNNGIVNPTLTQSQRLRNSVNYYLGGRTQFGNGNNARISYSKVTYLGKTEGQPGGIVGPIKNRF